MIPGSHSITGGATFSPTKRPNTRKIYGIIPVPRIIICILLGFLALTPAQAATSNGYSIEIIKSARQLILKRGNIPYLTFRIAYGKGDNKPKRERGDNRTPVGKYRIMGFKPDSKFYYFMQLNYPNLIDAWHGYKDRLITPSQFKQIALAFKNHEMPPQDTLLGGYIGIHGVGEVTREKMKIHRAVNWTDGCIALTNKQISILRRYVTIGTPVIIRN